MGVFSPINKLIMAPPDGVSAAEWEAQKKQRAAFKNRVALLSVPMTLSLIAAFVALIFVEPLRKWEIYTLLAAPTIALAYWLTIKSFPLVISFLPRNTPSGSNSAPLIQSNGGIFQFSEHLAHISGLQERQGIRALAFLLWGTISIILLTGTLSVNRLMDSSEGETVTLPIEKKFINSSKGRRHYKIEVASPAEPLLPVAFDTHETISTSAEHYSRIVPGQSLITIEIHKGALGIPWADTQHLQFSDLATNNAATSTANWSEARSSDLAAACKWRDSFNLAQEIPEIPAQDYRRDYWPNGQLRSEEPLVNGKPYGIGHYWWDNGRTYANIPYRRGQKHGSFTLYRADGTIEQQLSYKDGQPYGINSWFNMAGGIERSAVMLKDGRAYNVSDCPQ